MHIFQLGQYKGLGITPQPKYTESDLEAVTIETILQLTDQWSKSNSTVQDGDTVSISISAASNGIPVPELNMDNLKYMAGDPKMHPEFKEVIGKKKDDHFLMTIEFPPSSPISAAAGKTINLTAVVQEVSPSQKDRITDDIARQIDPGISSLEELKAKIRRSIEINYTQVMRENNILAVIEGILKNCTYELDPQELTAATEQIANQALQNNIFAQDPNLKQLTGIEADSYFYEDCRNLAEQQILIELIFKEIARLEKFDLSEDDIIADHLLAWNLAMES